MEQRKTSPEGLPGTLVRYQSIKFVSAGQIIGLYHGGVILGLADGTILRRNFLPNMTSRYTPSIGDYWVVYDDGYEALSPQKAFEEGYRVAEAPEEPIPPELPALAGPRGESGDDELEEGQDHGEG